MAAALMPTAAPGNASLIPSTSDLLMALPRLGSQIAGIFGFGADLAGPVNVTNNATRLTSILSNSVTKQLHAAASEPPTPLPASRSLWASFFTSFQRLGNLDGMLSYVASRWSVSTMVIALILNRAHVFASSREHVYLNWKSRLLLRLIPLLLLFYQVLQATRTMSCQTGHPLPQLRLNGTDTVVNRSWVGAPGMAHRLSSKALFWESVNDSCQATKMIPTGAEGSSDWYGSSTLMWPVYLTLAASQFSETISSALLGRQPMPETGMTLFEHSLAFAEAEMVVRISAGIGMFGLPDSATSKRASGGNSAPATVPTVVLSHSTLLGRLNVPLEVLLISLVSSLSHMSSHLLAIFGRQDHYRLANTALWGSMFMVLFITSFAKFAQPSKIDDIHIIRYPTVCIIGFVPHLLVLLGIMVCIFVYVLAIASTLISTPKWSGHSLRQRLRLAGANMSASTSMSNIRVSRTEDFYSCLLKVGYKMMTVATEAVYFNEGVQVTMTPHTWLERTRLQEATSSARSAVSQVPLELQEGFAGGEGFGLNDETPQSGPDGKPLASGFARERKTMTKSNAYGLAAHREEGVGVTQRSGRWTMSWRLVEATFSLVNYCHARMLVKLLEKFGRPPPVWLVQMSRLYPRAKADKAWGNTPADPDSQQQMLSDAGWLQIPKDPAVDVEAETRKRLQLGSSPSDATILDRNLYDWFKRGGWWGDTDTSGDYEPPHEANGNYDNDDTTSIISEASVWETDSSQGSSGTRTPTQEHPSPEPSLRRRHNHHPGPSRRSLWEDADTDTEDDMSSHLSNLANLLAPTTLAQKQEARMLSIRLREKPKPSTDGHASRPMTRSSYNSTLLRDRIAFPNVSIATRNANALLSREDEEMLLEQLLIERRRKADSNSTPAIAPGARGSDWASGGAGMGSAGPQCAVCRSAPRTVLVWPCRCLSLCDECRVSLAVNGFGSCVCCRRDVMAFSRLFVP